METLSRKLLHIETGSIVDCFLTLKITWGVVCEIQIDFIPNVIFMESNPFLCLIKLEFELEKLGWILLCNFSRIDIHPRSIVDSRRSHIWKAAYSERYGHHRTHKAGADLFDPIEPNVAVTLEAHAENFIGHYLHKNYLLLKSKSD
jgi:hypothetical protein